MLHSLHIQNLALIDQVHLEWHEGLNIVSGETGAGKSMLIDALSFVLGSRINLNLIQKDAEHMFVEAVFYIDTPILEFDDWIEEGTNEIIISRKVNRKGKSIIKVNHHYMNSTKLKSLATHLFDIHSQHATQKLLDSKNHIDYLDTQIDDFQPTLKKYQIQFRDYQQIISKIDDLKGKLRDREINMDFLRFQINEIDSANLLIGEEEELNKIKIELLNEEKKNSLQNKINDKLNNADHGALDLIKQSVYQLKQFSGKHPFYDFMLEKLEKIEISLEDWMFEFADYHAKQDKYLSEFNLNMIEERLYIIYQLKKKYGESIKDILNAKEIKSNELRAMEDVEFTIEKLQNDCQKMKNNLMDIAIKMSRSRVEQAVILEKKIRESCRDLNMEGMDIRIEITKSNQLHTKGMDQVKFLIAPNKGSEFCELGKIISGGELSRIMFALKSTLKVSTNVSYVFDEIDTGLSGKTAMKLAEQLYKLSKRNQIICISHLAQIVSMADQHILIEKDHTKEMTYSHMKVLNEAMQIKEVERLIGGKEGFLTAASTASELKNWAEDYKITCEN